MARRLLNIASIVCLVLCLALMGMWLRSYYRWDQIRGVCSTYFGFALFTRPGRLVLVESDLAWQGWSWDVASGRTKHRIESGASAVVTPPKGLGFAASLFTNGFRYLQIPFWFLVLISGTLAMTIQLRWPWRFTLRSLFVLTTFLAILLGMIAWLDRAWIGK
jgi:hypothetical protein